ncbi:MAG: transglycosylase SLT domain-containing protein [Proteobacteria bacterium]|nr:transglycosylase SLT domain-containing protein [Pseudomonadota bacterium]
MFLLVLLASGAGHADETFPLPTELQRDVDFWVNIFTRYSTDQGVLHDDRNLAIIYQRIDFPDGLDRRGRQRVVKKKREEVRKVLRSLASGKRDNLDTDESRVLALWPSGVSNQTLNTAARHVRYQQGLEDRFRQGLIRAGRWRDYIEQEFRDLAVPIELAALPHVESSYNPDARSHVGASGIWQFTRSTGRRYMRIDHVLDERNDPFVATRAAGKLLAHNYSITGNWPMAITAYNHGLAGVRRAMRKHGDTAYADIIRNYKGRTFGFASRNFYVAFLAAKQVDLNVEQYFPGIVIDQPTDFAEATLQAYIPVIDLTKALGVTPAQLATHNPALQATVWQGSKHLPKGFDIRLPSNLLDGPITDFMAKVPADRWQAKQLPDLFHTIARGDTLSEIAKAYDTRISTLVALNNLGSSHRIRAGQRLRLPAAGPAPVNQARGSAQVAPIEPPVVASAVTAVDESTIFDELTSSIMAGDLVASLLGTIQTALLSDPSDYSIASDTTIEVHPLETLGHYADWLGIRTQRLRDINGLAFRTPVEVGKRIRLELVSVDAKTFEDRRIAYHSAQQDGFFRKNIIMGVTQHVIRSGESIWILSLRKYDVPVWLFRQYNPELDLHNIRPGIVVRFPILASGIQP